MKVACASKSRPEEFVLLGEKVSGIRIFNIYSIPFFFVTPPQKKKKRTGHADSLLADNHMINGTKLLNVAGMTRGRRDGILKSEKVRHVVKIGPMHLKGVW